MAEQEVKVAVVGVGGMGSSHVKSCGTIEEVKLVAVCDINEERARQIGEEAGVPFYKDYRGLLAAGVADAVIVATPHYWHPRVAIDAFEAGLSVLSEKPIAVRIGWAEKMAEAARASGKVFSVMFQMRTQPFVKKALALAASGELGVIRRTLLVSPEFRSQAYYNSGSWRATWAGEGGGVLLNQAPHIMDIFCELGGMPTRVHGRCETLIHDIEVEDQAAAMLEYDNGATGYFYVSTCEVGPRIVEIVGDKGKLRLDGAKLSFWRFRPGVMAFNEENTEMWGKPGTEQVELDIEEAEHGHAVVIRNFARAILFGEERVAPGEVGLKSLELANAIILSSYKGEPVSLPVDREAYEELIESLKADSKFRGDWDQSRSETDPQFKK